ncbi:hypothetical protein GALMADRAFT_229763 [Galerina marginata CBS 339.88]|uniref:Uncharacterized protein n=1 Tax=Galerina marginata (strain CBS 339.88) TaxID=685588 RepID=A0A067SM36_GALM3|nr:hypothetical protein GALMADRAFT_229763 [Galerina marginata CBS 339.88]
MGSVWIRDDARAGKTWPTASSELIEGLWATNEPAPPNKIGVDLILSLMSSSFLDTFPDTIYQGFSTCFPAAHPSRNTVVNAIPDSRPIPEQLRN